jgi:oxygen-dependent protoporphyrinogen oxidase
MIDAHCIVVATTAASAARMLAKLLPHETDALHALEHAATVSSVTVELAFDRAAIEHPLEGTGFVVATAHQEHGLRACTFSTSKFEDRAPRERVLLRAFFRPEPADLSLSDEAWTERALAGLSRVLPIHGVPQRGWVSRWPDALPVHSPAHAAIVAQLEAALHPLSVCLAGAAFHGSGIDAAVRSGAQAARFLAAALPTHQAAPR